MAKGIVGGRRFEHSPDVDWTQFLVDGSVGVIGDVVQYSPAADCPQFFHFTASLADCRPIFGQQCANRTCACGTDIDLAKDLSIKRALAVYSASNYDRKLFVSCSRAGYESHLSEVPRESGINNRIKGSEGALHHDNVALLWSPVTDTATGQEEMVPIELIYPMESGSRNTNTSRGQLSNVGLAADFSDGCPTYSGLIDIIKHIALRSTVTSGAAPPQIRVETLSDFNYEQVAKLERCGLNISLLDLSASLGVPIVMAVGQSIASGMSRAWYGIGASSIPDEAVLQAIEDVAHAFIVELECAVHHEAFDLPAKQSERTGGHWIDTEALLSSTARLDFQKLPDALADDSRESVVATLSTSLAKVGHRVLVADLTPDDLSSLGLCAVRVLIPDHDVLEAMRSIDSPKIEGGITKSCATAGSVSESALVKALPEWVDCDLTSRGSFRHGQDREVSTWELFHENSKISSSDTVFDSPRGHWAPRFMERRRRFVLYPSLNLPMVEQPKAEALDQDAINGKRLLRGMTVNTLSQLLNYIRSPLSVGPTEEDEPYSSFSPRKASLSLFFHCIHIEGVPAGIYFVDPYSTTVRSLNPGGHTEKIQLAMFNDREAGSSELQVFVTADFTDSGLRHGEREYRNTLLQAGELTQIFKYGALRLGLIARVVHNFSDDQLQRCLGLNGIREVVLSALLVSSP